MGKLTLLYSNYNAYRSYSSNNIPCFLFRFTAIPLLNLSLFLFIFILSTPASAAKPQVIRMGAFNHYPAIFKDTDGKVKGFYVDALTEIEKKENIRFEYVYGSWSEGLERLQTGQIDVMPSVAYTPERARVMDFAKIPLITVWGELYVPLDSHIDGINGIKHKKVAVMKGDFNANYFIDLIAKFGIPCQFVEKPDFEEVFHAIIDKEVDAGIVNNTYGVARHKDYGLKTTGVIFNPFDIFFAVKKGRNQATLALLVDYLDKWQHSENSVYNQARQKWSHGNLGKLQVFPRWLLISAYSLGVLIIISMVFIVLLRKQVQRATRDITKSKEILQASEAKFRSYINNSPDGIFVVDDSGHYIDVNPAACEITGYSKQELLTKNIADLQPAETLEDDLKVFYLLKEKCHISYELKFVRKDGSVRWWSIDGVKLAEDRYLGFVRDIHDRKMSEQKLVEQKILFETMFNTITDGVVITDTERKIVLANKGMSTTFGYRPEELIGKSTELLYANDHEFKETGDTVFSEYASHSENLYLTYYKDKNNNIFPGETFGAKLYNSKSEWIGNLGIMRNISERLKYIEDIQQAKAKAEESDKLKTAFLQNMSHEIRTPLNAILGFSELLVKYYNDKQKLEYYTKLISNSSSNLLQIINEILEIAKIESGQLPIFMEPCNLKFLFYELKIYFTELRNAKNKQQIDLRFLYPEADFILITDGGKLRQILMNLLHNALKFTSEGSIEVNYEVLNDTILFYVKDTGIGILPEKQKLIFDRFIQAEANTSTQYGGTGLGLSIAKGLVELLGGKMWMESKPNQGSVFYFSLPLP